MDCLFCAIADGSILSHKVYEDEKVLGFLDINPTSLGHALFIPKKHADNALEAEDAAAVYEAAIQYARHVQDVLQAQGVNLISNIGEQAGQSVFHYHVHVIPRFSDETKDRLIYHHQALDEIDLDTLEKEVSLIGKRK